MLARQIARSNANVEVQELARRVAEARVELCRIRSARGSLLYNPWNDHGYDPAASNVAPTQEFALELCQRIEQLSTMDRYERGALVRLKRAMRAFDEYAIYGRLFYRTKLI